MVYKKVENGRGALNNDIQHKHLPWGKESDKDIMCMHKSLCCTPENTKQLHTV